MPAATEPMRVVIAREDWQGRDWEAEADRTLLLAQIGGFHASLTEVLARVPQWRKWALYRLPPLPRWSGDWQLGQPDLVVIMPQPYTMAATGSDVNRNFVVPVPIQQRRYVKGIEFHPGNGKIVHHAFVKVDRSGQARRLDAGGAEPGFSGLNPPGEVPDGKSLQSIVQNPSWIACPTDGIRASLWTWPIWQCPARSEGQIWEETPC